MVKQRSYYLMGSRGEVYGASDSKAETEFPDALDSFAIRIFIRGFAFGMGVVGLAFGIAATAWRRLTS